MVVPNVDERLKTSMTYDQARVQHNALEILEIVLEGKAGKCKEEMSPRETRLYIRASVRIMQVRLQMQVLEISGASLWGKNWWQSAERREGERVQSAQAD